MLSDINIFQNLSLAVPVDGGVTSMMSEPKVFLNLIPTNDSYVLHQGTWVQESSRAMWKFPELGLSSPGSGVGSIRARFQLKDGPGYQVEILSTRIYFKNIHHARAQ